ncbi:hypothetical protein PF008_g23405 [Phytophthora fragariae]|uniref:Tify domain-containing protein n=1 Tax=Phytophthora fragariae TaxID=53985 RepID=A0A6G0QQX3_9STRA|nr:hypothetical protein PF008_g23405 [Phytophthora fragariae]
MATTNVSVADAPARPETNQTEDSTTPPPAQAIGADADQVASAEAPPETQETQQKKTPLEGQSVAMNVSGCSHHAVGDGSRVSHPRAAAAAANAEMARQVKDEETPLSVMFAKAASLTAASKPPQPDDVAKMTNVAILADGNADVAMMKDVPPPVEEGRRRPSRAAAAAANAGMTRQVQEEAGSLGMLLASALVRPMEQEQVVEAQSTDKKRTSDMATPPAKRSRVTGSRKVAQNTLEIASAELQPQRGKKRRQAPVFEAAPIITDLPPLPFTTTSPELKLKNKNKAKNKRVAMTKMKAKQSVEEVEGDGRRCEFCRKAANLCVLMHCHACRRVYHAQCFWHAFQPYVDRKVPILDQLQRLQAEAPERRGNIFRCASCRAALVDFCDSGGYLWDCDCPTCTQPEKVVYYRQRKLVDMMNDMELEKQRKRDLKDQAAKAKKSGVAKPPTSTPSRSNSTSRSRRTRGSSAALDEEVVNARTTQPLTSRGAPPGLDPKKEKDVNADAMDVVDGEGEVKSAAAKAESETKAEPMDVDEGVGTQPAANAEKTVDGQKTEQQVSKIAEQQHEPHSPQAGALQQEAKTLPELQQPTTDDAFKKEQEHLRKVKYEPVGEPEQPDLKGDDLVGAVRVLREGKSDRWCFPVVCSRTTSLRVSGMMKTGTCKWSLKKRADIQCECCDKVFNFPEFVHHTDSSLIKDPKCASEDPMPYLFVEHRDTTHHTPLEKFLSALRIWAARQSANNTPTKSRRGHAVRQEAIAAVSITTMTMTNPEAAVDALPEKVSRLRALALFKRPKHRNDKTSLAARLSDPASLDFLAQVVCLSPKYVMNMANGSLADRVVRSKTPVPDDSFPRKAGWLAFNQMATMSRQVTCICCEKSFSFDGFVDHAGILLNELKKKSRQLLYVVEKMDESALVPYNTFAMDLDTVAKANGLDVFLDELLPPPPSPRPI